MRRIFSNCPVTRPVVSLAMAFCAASGMARAQTTYPIQHVIVIMQENRSFDSYFGTFPGADGIPAKTCVPLDPTNPQLGCVKPFHDPHDVNAGGSHDWYGAEVDLDDGIVTDKMDGFVAMQSRFAGGCKPPAYNYNCARIADGIARHDAVGYHTAEEIPNYWAYASNFVLQDHLFEGVRSYSWPSHLDLTSEWVATCTDYSKASTCKSAQNAIAPVGDAHLPWVSLFQLLDVHAVSWKYYLGTGAEPDCEDGEMTCAPQIQTNGVGSFWNPAPFFNWVKAEGPAYLQYHNPNADQFLVDIQNGTLPQVSWVVPNANFSEHPPAGVTRGMGYVTSLVNAVMQSPYWNNTVIFLAWDDWGGFYDQVVPPNVDRNSNVIIPIQGFGLRVPGITISAYAKAGMIDHNVLSFASYATFVEDIFMGGARLDPKQLGNPDNRPDIRDALTAVTFPNGARKPIGNLMDEFDFDQAPLPPLVLSTHIPAGIVVTCTPTLGEHCTSSTVTISWSPVTGPDISGTFTYHVQRDGVELPRCTGTSIGCKDNPGSGVHLYRVYSVDSNNVASPLSAAAEADEP